MKKKALLVLSIVVIVYLINISFGAVIVTSPRLEGNMTVDIVGNTIFQNTLINFTLTNPPGAAQDDNVSNVSIVLDANYFVFVENSNSTTSSSNLFTNASIGNSLILTWNVSDPGTFSNGTSFDFVFNITPISGVEISSSVITVEVGNYTGNLLANDISTAIAVDSKAPLVSLITLNNTNSSTASNVVLNFSVGDLNKQSCALYIGNITAPSPSWGLNTSGAAGTFNNLGFSYNFSSDGTYIWNIWCNDSLGHIAFNSTNYTVTIDTTSPSFGLNGTNVSTVASGSSVLLWANFSDLTTGIRNATLYLGATEIYTNTTGISLGTSANFTFNYTSGVQYIGQILNFTINVTDYAGNKNASNILRITVTDGEKPSVVLNSPVPNYNSSSTNITFSFTVIDTSALICNLTLNGTVNLSNINVTSGNPYTNTTPNLMDGVYSWNVTCWDSANIINTSLTQSFTVDTIFPITAPNLTYVNDSNLDGNVELNWAADTNAALYGVFRASSNLTNATLAERVGNTSNTSFNDTTAVSGTSYWYAVTSIDYAGNENLSIINTTTGTFMNATANDTLAPALPANITVVQEAGNTAIISWRRVSYDVLGNPDTTNLKYKLWKKNSGVLNSSLNLSANGFSLLSDSGYTDNSTSMSFSSTTNYMFVVTTIDDANNENLSYLVSESDLNFVNVTLTYTEQSNPSPSNVDSGSSGGTAPSLVEQSQIEYSKVWNFVESGLNITVNKELIPVEYVSFRLIKRISDLQFSVSTITEPDFLTRLEHTPYSYLKFFVKNTNDSLLIDPLIKFKVKNDWLSQYSLNKNEIVLYRYKDRLWHALPTTLTKEDATYSYYAAQTPGFSYFAIASITARADSVIAQVQSSSNESVQQPQTQQQTSQSSTTSSQAQEQPTDNGNQEMATTENDINLPSGMWYYIILGLLVVAGALFGFYFMRTKAQESALDQLQTLEALDEKSSNKFPVQRPVASVKLLVPVQPLQTEVKKRSNAQQLADDNSLVNYIQAQLKKSVSEDKLRKVLLHAGWPQQKIDFAFKSIKK